MLALWYGLVAPLVLPLVALYPPLKHKLSLWGELPLYPPVLKFWLAYVAEAALAVLLTLLAVGASPVPPSALLVAAIGALVNELAQLVACLAKSGGYRGYTSDVYNVPDLISTTLTVAALAVHLRHGGDDPTAVMALSAALLFEHVRLSRVLLLSPTRGPYLLMFFVMIRDVLRWLCVFAFILLAFSASVFALTARPPPDDAFLPELVPLYECLVPVGAMSADGSGLWWHGVSGWLSTMLALLEGALVGDPYFECMHRSGHPAFGVIHGWGVNTSAPVLDHRHGGPTKYNSPGLRR